MCLLMTAGAAVIVTLIWYLQPSEKGLKLGFLALMYWGAALMWMVDGFYCVAASEPFLDLSLNDALLGFVVVLCGMTIWLARLLIQDPKGALRKKLLH